ncbi:MAG TPA: zinc ribbon domain-containing protein, partial [Ktedonobacteraceae bacterium]|nr:zinc ribbon domain-containing protein [Ktedonobacteraceae bacterium]
MSSPRFCSECGKPLEAGHSFCTNCGATTSAEADARTALTNEHTQSAQSQFSTPQDKGDATASTIITPDADAIPPPPPPDSFISMPNEISAAPYFTPSSQGNGNVPVYAQAPKRSKGCLITSIVLLLVLVLGGIGGFYIIRRSNSTGGSQNGSSSSGQQNISSSSSNTQTSVTTPGSSGNTPGAGGPTTIPLNLKFTYSSVDITLVSVQRTNSFPDDTSSPQGGIRVKTMESNPTTNNVRYSYSDITRLIM